MPYVFNTTDKKINVQAFGNYIPFGPKQIKMIHNEKIAEFIAHKRREEGLVDYSEEMYERTIPRFLDDEAKKYYEDKIKEGAGNRIVHLERVIHNVEVGLRRDLEMANIKADPLVFASTGEVDAYKELAQYKDFQRKSEMSNADQIRKLKESIDGNTQPTNDRAFTSGSPSSATPAKK